MVRKTRKGTKAALWIPVVLAALSSNRADADIRLPATFTDRIVLSMSRVYPDFPLQFAKNDLRIPPLDAGWRCRDRYRKQHGKYTRLDFSAKRTSVQ